MTILMLQFLVSLGLSFSVYLLLPTQSLYALFLEKRLKGKLSLMQTSLFALLASKLFKVLPLKQQEAYRQKYEANLKLVFSASFNIESWWLLKLTGVFLGFVSGYLFGSVLLWFCFSYLGFKLPDIWLEQKTKERKEEIEKNLPDLIDFLVIGLEAGLNFDKATKVYTQKFSNLLASELEQFLAQIATGKSRQEALKELADRYQSEEMSLFVNTLRQADKLGTPLATALSQVSLLAREKQKQKVKELVAKAPVKMLFPTAALILPALLVVVMGPMAIRLFSGGWL